MNKLKTEYLYTIDDGFTALIKVWRTMGFDGKWYICHTIHPRTARNNNRIK